MHRLALLHYIRTTNFLWLKISFYPNSTPSKTKFLHIRKKLVVTPKSSINFHAIDISHTNDEFGVRAGLQRNQNTQSAMQTSKNSMHTQT